MPAPGGRKDAARQSLGYNKSNRLQSAAGPWGTKTYTYDGTGNRTTEVTGSVTDTLGYPGGSNRISNVVTGATTTRTYTHDILCCPPPAGGRQHHHRRPFRIDLRLRLECQVCVVIRPPSTLRFLCRAGRRAG